MVANCVVSVVFDGKNIIHTLGLMQYLGFHLTTFVVSSSMLAVFFIGCYLEGDFRVIFHPVHGRDGLGGESF